MADSNARAREVFGKIPCTPADSLFAGPDGKVHESETPKVFVGALLAGRYHIVKYIESGAFGRGWICQDTKGDDPNKNLFCKTFRSVSDRPSSGNPDGHEHMVHKELEVLLQAEALKLPAHPNIVTPPRVHYGTVEVPSTGSKGEMFFVVTADLCEGGELYNYLVFGSGIKKFDEKIARYFFKQLAEGVAHLHRHGIFHRDLKLENIVLDSHYVAKLMDFGHAKHASDCATTVDQATGQVGFQTQTFVGTASYQPPELKHDSQYYNPAAFDVWSLGVVLFFLVGIEGLAAKGNDFTFISKIKNDKAAGGRAASRYLSMKMPGQDVPDNAGLWEYFGKTLTFSKELKHIINGMLTINAKDRFTIEQVLKDKWLEGEMPTHEEVVAALSGRSTGIVERDLVFSLADNYPDQNAALAAVQKALDHIAPYKTHGHKIGVCDPPRFAIAVSETRRVRVIWLTGGLDEWLEFRGYLAKNLNLPK
eukprot:m.92973 g.92973  ORF g.92973 m.92973 type:complete len:478 (+) comp15351_c0_seq2:161-1594(+)